MIYYSGIGINVIIRIIIIMMMMMLVEYDIMKITIKNKKQ